MCEQFFEQLHCEKAVHEWELSKNLCQSACDCMMAQGWLALKLVSRHEMTQNHQVYAYMINK